MFTLFLRELPVYLAPSGVRSARSTAERGARLPRQRMRRAGTGSLLVR